ncbi:GAF domain-containing protein [Hymenobacter nivis]|uniref:GAF domain-containing protein n=1 Tax=Hymenobacter nivis TaxID=1850093 RepID=A0A502GAG4_9BACT|nr:GAF domain-containing protein [Hymenobacter nivis]TPG58975.1 GAF domain-containing protein [Hymenobacter nivis]
MANAYPDSLIPGHDAARLRTLHQFQIVNTTPEPVFDDFAAWAAQLFGTPIALISLVDADFTWFKALVGVDSIPGLVRNESMCSAAILQDAAVVVSDYKPESCTLIRPDVAQALGLSFYAGAVLEAADGHRLGMLAIIDKEARHFSAAEQAVLARLAGLVSQTIALRHYYLAAGEQGEWDDAQRDLTHALDDNAALARYLTSRNQRIDFDDEAVAQPVVRRLEGVAQVLARRLAQALPALAA